MTSRNWRHAMQVSVRYQELRKIEPKRLHYLELQLFRDIPPLYVLYVGRHARKCISNFVPSSPAPHQIGIALLIAFPVSTGAARTL